MVLRSKIFAAVIATIMAISVQNVYAAEPNSQPENGRNNLLIATAPAEKETENMSEKLDFTDGENDFSEDVFPALTNNVPDTESESLLAQEALEKGAPEGAMNSPVPDKGTISANEKSDHSPSQIVFGAAAGLAGLIVGIFIGRRFGRPAKQ